ncbi:virulence RhuM family protein [bacterium]|nr:virulence RhuM family protein [bacterium]
MKKHENQIVLFESSDKTVVLDVIIDKETVWLTQAQMAALFDVNRSVITKHINNVFSEKEVEEKSNVQKMHFANSDKPVKQYSLDIIISVGYRVKSLRGIEFRRWANSVLKQFILQGYAVNQKRLQTLGETKELVTICDRFSPFTTRMSPSGHSF